MDSEAEVPLLDIPEPEVSTELSTELHPWERYTIVRIHRSQLLNAPYNPRVMSAGARRKLKEGIAKLGLIAPPTWNVRTGFIVGGHQRVDVLDLLAGKPDYMLTVAQVDLDEKQEREANLLLNNPEAMGDWDLDKLVEVLHNEEIGELDLRATGFDAVDLYRLLGDAPLQQAALSTEALDEVAERLRSVRAQYDATVQERGEAEDQFYMVVIFSGQADLIDFLEKHKLELNRYQDGRDIRRLCGEKIDEERPLPPGAITAEAVRSGGVSLESEDDGRDDDAADEA